MKKANLASSSLAAAAPYRTREAGAAPPRASLPDSAVPVPELPLTAVAQGVDHPAALLAGVHKTREPQPRQMLADRGPGRAAGLGERGDIGLAAGQGVQQGQPGAVAEQGEQLRREREVLLAGCARVLIVRR